MKTTILVNNIVNIIVFIILFTAVRIWHLNNDIPISPHRAILNKSVINEQINDFFTVVQENHKNSLNSKNIIIKFKQKSKIGDTLFVNLLCKNDSHLEYSSTFSPIWKTNSNYLKDGFQNIVFSHLIKNSDIKEDFIQFNLQCSDNLNISAKNYIMSVNIFEVAKLPLNKNKRIINSDILGYPTSLF